MPNQLMRDDAPAEPPPADQQPAERRQMTPRLALLTSITILAVLIGAAVIAIFIFRGDSPDADLTEYFEAVEVLVNDIDDRSGSGTVRSPSDVFIKWAVVLRETAGQLEAIETPPEAADAHAELATALDDAGVILANFPDQHTDVASIEEADELVSADAGILEADGRARTACAELQTLADENEIEVELELCPQARG